MSLKDDPSVLRIPHNVVFPPTDYSHKLRMATMWVRKRHPQGPVAVYACGHWPRHTLRFDEVAHTLRDVNPPDVRGFLVPDPENPRDPDKLRFILKDKVWIGGNK